jgi:anti-anti-sigma regulatory factor
MLTLKLLKNEGGVVKFDAAGKISRDGWIDHKEPFASTFGDGIFKQHCLLCLNHALYIDSTGVEWLLTAHRRFEEQGGMLVLHSPTDSSRQLLKLMRMDLVLNIVADEASALELIRSKMDDGNHKNQ